MRPVSESNHPKRDGEGRGRGELQLTSYSFFVKAGVKTPTVASASVTRLVSLTAFNRSGFNP
ncbi:hypothetical protein B9Q06_03300 [Candidatus Marsarchaeota G2 archaeon ECH_B_2]|uniref:Uncharacterized protein n=3 Tax=Candidatus Marsarchaeota group 2 TaxID=2203771 RepID=A0A2R6BBX4_9ARCH|nr:MAG: hypothetical protein B9Q06_03300 [Candidatus Marsarchaeota G2 archaeon ECH_B_2]PSO00188.1 MAG: hypothetical protein B9Q07_04505 [Candidatus Marsarchaeota G2 archaeon ECH_B_3]PSO02683.1 MAG: hypothetical protein B9Q05_04035 [Candidatus Marsarchaeota G2 archaeon ECH_B_1]